LNMSGVLLGEGFLCLLSGPIWLGLLSFLQLAGLVVAVSLLEKLVVTLYCGWRLAPMVSAMCLSSC